MKLILENIGMLRHAEITLHQLCVIAGENDNGKSTAGKILFCIVKAINRYKEDLLESKELRIQDKSMELFFLYRRAAVRTDSLRNDPLRLPGLLSSRNYQFEPEDLAQLIRNIENSELDLKEKQSAHQIYREIMEIYDEPENTNNLIENAFKKVFALEFDGQLLTYGAKQGSIRLIENDITIINLEITERTTKLLGEVALLEFTDATFIESPLILNHYELLSQSSPVAVRRKSRNATALHTTDLFQKLRVPVLESEDLLKPTNQEVLAKLDVIINGEISHSKRNRNFLFTRDDLSFVIKNTASGIKVFGILQILLKNEFLAKNTVVIFDEPENHLHPKWQIKLAQFLVELAGNGIYVMISSHSPYMIEALKRYADKDSVSAGFYLAESNEIMDNDRLSDIFQILSEPFETFRNMDAEELLNDKNQ